MKKTKLLTSLAAFVLVLGLGACELPEEETTSDESGEVTTTDTDTTTKETNPDGYAIVGDFVDSSWNESPATDSVYYIPAGTEHYEATVEVPTADTLGYEPSFRVVEYGTWNLVADYDNLDVDNSTGVTGSHGNDNNIELAGGTYDLVFDFGETNTILVTLQTEEGGDEGGDTEPIKGLLGFDVSGVNYYIDGTTQSDGNYRGEVTANIDEAIEVTCTEVEGDNAYYLTFELDSTIYYVCIIDTGSYINLQYLTTATPIYWDETHEAWVNEEDTYFLCYNATYKCAYASDFSSWWGSSPVAGLLDYPTIEGITLSAATQSIYIDRSVTISVSYTPSTIGASNLEWESSSENVVTVENGVVTGVAVGTATISATTLNGKSDSIEITVTEVPAGQEEVKLGTYDFSTKDASFDSANGGTNAISATQLKTTLDTYWTSEDSYSNPLDTVNSTTYIYQYFTSGNSSDANKHGLLKTGSSNNNGTMNLTMVNSITKVEISQMSWTASENCTITVNDAAEKKSTNPGSVETLTFEISEATVLDFTFAKRCSVYSITLYGYAA